MGCVSSSHWHWHRVKQASARCRPVAGGQLHGSRLAPLYTVQANPGFLVLQDANLWDVTLAPTIVMTQRGVRRGFQEQLRAKGVEVVQFDFLTPDAVAHYCSARGFLQCLWECGGTLAAPAIASQTVHKAMAFIAPKLVRCCAPAALTARPAAQGVRVVISVIAPSLARCAHAMNFCFTGLLHAATACMRSPLRQLASPRAPCVAQEGWQAKHSLRRRVTLELLKQRQHSRGPAVGQLSRMLSMQIGGVRAPSPVGDLGNQEMTQALPLAESSWAASGSDMLLEGTAAGRIMAVHPESVCDACTNMVWS